MGLVRPLLLLLLILGCAGWLMLARLGVPRASGERMILGTQAEQVRSAFVMFEREQGRAATGFGELEQAGYATADDFRPFVYLGDEDYLFVMRTPADGVAAGARWGGPGETTDRAIPAARLVVHADGRLAWVDEADFDPAILGGR